MTWKPVNPCTPDCKGRDSYCPPRNRFGCEDFKIYQGKLEMAKQLLEYLIARPTLMNLTQETVIRVIYISELESRLKELEGK